MRHIVSPVLVVALLVPSLGGCAAPGVPQAPGVAAGPVSMASRPAASAQDLARSLAGRLRATGWQAVTVSGPRVEARTAAGEPMAFDLTDAPRTRLVAVTVDGVTATVPLSQAADEAADGLGPVIVAVVARMAFAAGKAYVAYRLTHPGSSFDGRECAAVVTSAMVVAATAMIPGIGPGLAVVLGPIVKDWLDKILHVGQEPSVKAFVEAGKEQMRELAAGLRKLVRQQRAGAQAGAR